MLENLEVLLRAFASAFTQQTRLLTLEFGGEGFKPNDLLPSELNGEAELSHCYRYTLDCLSSDAHKELKSLLGLPVQIGIRTPTGDERIITGLVTKAETVGSNGGFSKYRLTVEPALALLTHRRSSRVFQDQNVIQIIKTILDEHAANNAVFAAAFDFNPQVEKTYPARSYCLQYRESDLEFIERLLREEGISYRFTFAEGKTPVHTLVLFDDPYSLEISGLGKIRFHRADGTESEDTLQTWESVRQIQPAGVSLASFDYKTVATHQSGDATTQDQGSGGEQAHSTLEDYDPQTLYYGNPEELGRYAQLRQQAYDLNAKSFTATGTVRNLNVGEWFMLWGHPVHDTDLPEERQFAVIGQKLHAVNNLPGELKSGLSDLLSAGSLDMETLLAKGKAALGGDGKQEPPYSSELKLVRRGIPLVPSFAHSSHAKPKSQGVQTATVVGPQASGENGEAEEIHTDELGRIKIQFHWQRKSEHPEFGANLDDRSSCWIRVAYPSAGAGWGHQFIPRVGQEVLVDFIEGDIDRPIVTGVVYNGTHTPPTFNDAGSLPTNKTLSGIKSKEYKGAGFNQLKLDDSTGQISSQLYSKHAETQLNLGWLGTARTEGKSEARGEGAELATDAALALRAAQGMLLSTDARPGASGHQLAREELLNHLETALNLIKTLGDTAKQANAMEVDPEPNEKLNTQLKDWENGSNTKEKESNGGSPIIAMTAPGGIAQATPETISQYAGKNLDQTAQGNLQQSAGQQATLNAAKGISLFSHAEGLRVIAHQGQFVMQSQTDGMDINAQKGINLTSSAGNIDLGSAKNILIQASGGSYLKIGDGKIEFGCPGEFTVKAAKHNWAGGASMNIDMPRMPKAAILQQPMQFDLRLADAPGAETHGCGLQPWQIVSSTSEPEGMALVLDSEIILKGTTNADGVIELSDADQKTLQEAYCAQPGRLWLMQPGHSARLNAVKESSDWNDDEWLRHLMSAADFSADVHNHSHSEGLSEQLSHAKNMFQARSVKDLVQALKKKNG